MKRSRAKRDRGKRDLTFMERALAYGAATREPSRTAPVDETRYEMPSGYDLYCVQMGEGGPIKIGRTTDVDGRLRGLQSASPVKLSLIKVVRGGGHIETDLHYVLKAHRMEGEWFSPHPDVLDAIALAELRLFTTLRYRWSKRNPSCCVCGVMGPRLSEDGVCRACDEFADDRERADPFDGSVRDGE